MPTLLTWALRSPGPRSARSARCPSLVSSVVTGRLTEWPATLLALCLSMVLPATADSPLSLGLALLVFGACYGATDVAMNSAAVQLSAVVDRPIVPQFHSAYSLGALGGAESARRRGSASRCGPICC